MIRTRVSCGALKPASLNVLTQAVTSVVVIVFLVTLIMSFLGGGLATRLTCLVLGAVLVAGSFP